MPGLTYCILMQLSAHLSPWAMQLRERFCPSQRFRDVLILINTPIVSDTACAPRVIFLYLFVLVYPLQQPCPPLISFFPNTN